MIYHFVTSNYNLFYLQLLILYFTFTIDKIFFFYIILCNVGSTSISLQLLPLLLMRIIMKGNHVLVDGSLGRHYQCQHIIRTWIDQCRMLYVGLLIVTTVQLENLSLSHYFTDISDGIHLFSYTDQRRQCDSSIMCRPFLHTLLLHPYLQRTLTIDGFSFHNTLHRLDIFVVLLDSVQQTT